MVEDVVEEDGGRPDGGPIERGGDSNLENEKLRSLDKDRETCWTAIREDTLRHSHRSLRS